MRIFRASCNRRRLPNRQLYRAASRLMDGVNNQRRGVYWYHFFAGSTNADFSSIA